MGDFSTVTLSSLMYFSPESMHIENAHFELYTASIRIAWELQSLVDSGKSDGTSHCISGKKSKVHHGSHCCNSFYKNHKIHFHLLLILFRRFIGTAFWNMMSGLQFLSLFFSSSSAMNSSDVRHLVLVILLFPLFVLSSSRGSNISFMAATTGEVELPTSELAVAFCTPDGPGSELVESTGICPLLGAWLSPLPY